MTCQDETKVVSFGKWASILLFFITTTYTSLKFTLGLLSSSNKRRLEGRNVLITNGESSLSQKIGQTFEQNLDCNVIYMKKCDRRSTNDYEKVINDIYQQHERIDVIVHNQHQYDINISDGCFVLNEGESLMEILNIFKHCIPKMYTTGGGHFISIKSRQSSFRALINTRNDLRNYTLDLINTVAQNNQSSPPQTRPEFSMSVIQCDSNWMEQVSEKEVVRKIFDAVVSQRAVIRLGTGVWHSFKSVLKYFNKFHESSLHLL